MFSLEVIWRAGSAYAFTRGDGDVFTDGGLTQGEPGIVHVLDFEIDARRLSVPELIEFAADPPNVELGDSARASSRSSSSRSARCARGSSIRS